MVSLKQCELMRGEQRWHLPLKPRCPGEPSEFRNQSKRRFGARGLGTKCADGPFEVKKLKSLIVGPIVNQSLFFILMCWLTRCRYSLE